MERRDFLRLLGVTFAAPLPLLRSLVDPLRAVPAAIAALTPLHLIGWRAPQLYGPRWTEVRLLREPADSLQEMSRAALADGVRVWARSGHRSLSQQRYLWNAKYRGHDTVRTEDGRRLTLRREQPAAEKVRLILSYTAFPGTSRHHWGTDVDMAQTFADGCADLLLQQDAGPPPDAPVVPAGDDPAPAARKAAEQPPDDCLPAQRWLAAHAHEFGWYLVYDAPRGGFQPEPWHWSYLPFAVPALARYLEEVEADLLRDRGIDGADVVLDDFAAYRDRFLLGVCPDALPGAAPSVAPSEDSPAPAP
ncbi:MAG: M15 family metallopeptidase [Myxococcales bacterium]|nr:M15 family metallopeptidase [Myxococcales bacterium]